MGPIPETQVGSLISHLVDENSDFKKTILLILRQNCQKYDVLGGIYGRNWSEIMP